jgi:hypothetical protein
MPVVTIDIGHPIFIIERTIIMKAKITRFIKQNEVMVSTDPSNWTVERTWEEEQWKVKQKREVEQKIFTYGIDFFFTYEKARKGLLIRAENIGKKRLEEEERRQRGTIVQEKVKYYPSRICTSCGTTIDSYGRCGCSD